MRNHVVGDGLIQVLLQGRGNGHGDFLHYMSKPGHREELAQSPHDAGEYRIEVKGYAGQGAATMHFGDGTEGSGDAWLDLTGTMPCSERNCSRNVQLNARSMRGACAATGWNPCD